MIDYVVIIAIFLLLIIFRKLEMNILEDITMTSIGMLAIIFRKRLANSMTKTQLRIAKRKKRSKEEIQLIQPIGNKIYTFVAIIFGIIFIIISLVKIVEDTKKV